MKLERIRKFICTAVSGYYGKLRDAPYESGFENINLYKESVHGARSLIYHGIDLRRITHARTASHVRPAEDFIATSTVYGGDNEAMYT